MSKTIGLSQGKFAVVDDEDFERLNQYKWSWEDHPYGNGRAQRKMRCSDGKMVKIFMHREILGVSKGMQVDHINHDTLDNRKQNLRSCTNTENGRNRTKFKGCSSIYKGVCLVKGTGRWRASTFCDGKAIYLGIYDDPVEAALAYDRFAAENYGEFAVLNFQQA